jgi:hypothetical protein
LADESSAVGGGVGVDFESEHVDGDVVVVPTKRYEVVGIVITTEMLLVDVVDLEAVA